MERRPGPTYARGVEALATLRRKLHPSPQLWDARTWKKASRRPDDTPLYFRIGSRFAVNGDRFVGPVIASRYAAFLCVGIEPIKFATIPLSLFGGPIGTVLGASIDCAMRHDPARSPLDAAPRQSLEDDAPAALAPELVETRLEELPTAVTHDPDWPLRRRPKGRVFVVWRASVHSVRPIRRSLLVARTACHRVSIDLGLAPPERVHQRLRHDGWPLA